jgi:DNA-binding phage protein
MEENKHKRAGELLMRFLNDEAKSKGLSTYEIAERTGFDQSHVCRMLNAKYLPNLENFIKLADAIGIRLELHTASDVTDVSTYRNADTPRFLFAPYADARELYILHTHSPACLIKVVQKMPVEMEIVEAYEPLPADGTTDLINDAHDFFIQYSTDLS